MKKKKYNDISPARLSGFSDGVTAVIITLLVIGVLLIGGVAFYKLRRSPVDRGSLALVDAFSSRRLIEPRYVRAFQPRFSPSLLTFLPRAAFWSASIDRRLSLIMGVYISPHDFAEH